ncbi:hypothetical protein ES703_91203 [subsurface metagenome]
MLDLGLAQKPKPAARYPHLLQEDIIIWQRFIKNGLYLPDVVWYDVRCGNSVILDMDLPDWMTKMSLRLTRKRIDVVGRVGRDYWVIEIKPRASYDAFGQVVFYADQFQKDYSPPGEVFPIIITDLVDMDIVSLCGDVGVCVLEVCGDTRLHL